MLTWLSRLRSYFWPARQTEVVRPFSRYDAARTTGENREHWKYTDSLSPNGAANPVDRKILRERARYEVANNSFAFGAANSLAEDAIGSGPRLQLLGLPEEATRQIENLYRTWQDETEHAQTLRTLYRAQGVDGEGFGLEIFNPALRHPVKLDLRPFEADRCTNPAGFLPSDRLADGIEFDDAGNPTWYTVLRQHPGDQLTIAPGEWDRYPARQVYHLFRVDRPGQFRGVSWLTPALPLFAQLRRYTLAVLAAAETAANIAGILKSELPPDAGTAPTFESMEEVPIPRNALLTAPAGWDVSQLKAEQPTQTFGDFRTQILIEIGRALDMPLNRITGNSSGYNYSSGRLDHMGYHRGIWQQRERLRLRVLYRLFRAWLDEAVLVGLIPDGLPPFEEWEWDWQWDAFGDIDPQTEATAAGLLLDLNITDLAEQCAARGRRWDQVLRQRARELALMRELGIPLPGGSSAPAANQATQPMAPASPATDVIQQPVDTQEVPQ